MRLSASVAENLVSILKRGGSVLNPATGTRGTAIVDLISDYMSKIVIFGKGNKTANKLGMKRIITEFNNDGSKRMKVEFSVPSSLYGGWGGARTLEGNADQMKRTFKYLNSVVDENCNTISALDKLESLYKIIDKNLFAKRVF